MLILLKRIESSGRTLLQSDVRECRVEGEKIRHVQEMQERPRNQRILGFDPRIGKPPRLGAG